MTIQTDTRKNWLDTPFLSTFTLNWEIVLYTLFFILAVATRFYDVGARVMSHDESLHTLFSWNLYAGKGYQHDPMMHGPSLFHITALMYFLFGDSDFTARLGPVLFGVAMVILPYWFRPWLGRIGALAASFMILISPGLLYYSRYIRHDTFLDFFTLLMFLAFFQYMRTRATRWLFIGAVGVSLMICTMEAAYIHGFIGVTFIAWAFMWENLSETKRSLVTWGMVGFVLLLLIAAIILTYQANGLPPAEGQEKTFDIWQVIHLIVMVMGLTIAALLARAGIDRYNRPVTAALRALPAHRPALLQAVLLAVIIFTLLYTTFFSNIKGLWTGSGGALVYWLSQQEVQRGGQPWYYYLFLVPMYEFLPVLTALFGGLVYLLRGKLLPAHADTADAPDASTRPHWPSDGGTFAIFIIYWAFLAFVIYSWAGEKMPWLSVHMTLPCIFVTAHVIQTVFNRFNWAEARRRGGFILGGVLLLLIPALVALFTADPFRGQSLQAIQDTLQFVLALVVFVGLGAGVWYYSRYMGLGAASRVALATVLLVLTLLTVRFAWMFNYINYDYVNEMLVYAHGSPDVKLALAEIDDISRRTVGDKMIKVPYDDDSTWPLEWYMREYPNRAYYGDNPTRENLDAPVIIVGSKNEDKVKPFLGDRYVRQSYRLVWWPVEDYKNQSFAKLWENYVVGPPPENPQADTAANQDTRRAAVRHNWKNLWNIFFYHYFEDYKLSEWPYMHRFYLYVRKDVLNQIWDYQSGPVQPAAAVSLDPYARLQIQADAQKIWGSQGQNDGQFLTPRNVAVGPDGRVYVADTGNHRIQVFDKDGNFLFKWGSQGAEINQFNEPWGITVDGKGQVYVADTWNHRIQIFTANGEYVNSFGSFLNIQGDPKTDGGKFWGPRDVAVDAQGNIYVTDTGNKRVQKFSPAGQFLDAWGGGGITPGSFEEPVGIELDRQGNFYVTDTWNHRIQKFDANFKPVAQWPVSAWDDQGVVNKPYLAVDAQGRIFISDPKGYRIIAFDNNGQAVVTWGQYGQDRVSFSLPTGLAFDSEGQLLVADADNNRIMKFTVPLAPTKK